MNTNTLKTNFGYLRTMLRKIGLLKLESKSIAHIYNYVPISKRLSTSGQPSALELQKIREAGFNAVVNLAPHNAENSLDNEAAIVTGLGLSYTHIPVDFKNPAEADFDRFVEAMKGLAECSILHSFVASRSPWSFSGSSQSLCLLPRCRQGITRLWLNYPRAWEAHLSS